MTRISVLGGTGYAGAAIVREAAGRGHEVTAFSRKPPEAPVPGVRYITGSVLDPEVLAQAFDGAEVVLETVSPRGDMANRLDGLIEGLMTRARESGVRLGVLGGASSLLVEPGGPRLFDLSEPPAAVRPEIEVGLRKLDTLRAAEEGLDWFYLSPPAEFGAWVPSVTTGAYRLSDDVLLKDEAGRSEISAADLAIAVVDETEPPTPRRRRFHVAH